MPLDLLFEVFNWLALSSVRALRRDYAVSSPESRLTVASVSIVNCGATVAVTLEGDIVVPCNNGLQVIRLDGSIVWMYCTKETACGSVSVDPDGSVVALVNGRYPLILSSHGATASFLDLDEEPQSYCCMALDAEGNFVRVTAVGNTSSNKMRRRGGPVPVPLQAQCSVYVQDLCGTLLRGWDLSMGFVARSVAVSRDGVIAVAGFVTGTNTAWVHLISAAGKCMQRLALPALACAASIAWDADGNLVFLTCLMLPRHMTPAGRFWCVVWDPVGQRVVWTAELGVLVGGPTSVALTVAPSGTIVIALPGIVILL